MKPSFKNPIKNALVLLVGGLFGAFLGMLIIHVSVLLDITEAIQERFASVIFQQAISSQGQLFESIAIVLGFAVMGILLVYGLLQQKLLLQSLVKLEAARESNKSKDAFVSMLLHYIRTPLAGIRWSLKSLLDAVSDQAQKEQVARMYQENLRALDAVEHLLEVSRTSMGKIAYRFEVVSLRDLTKLIRETADQMSVQAQKKKISFIVRTAHPSEHALKADREKIVSVVQTLVENAIHYTPEGGTITLTTEEQEADFVVSVADTGIGIPRTDESKIFLQFFRSENARRIFAGGFGVGLYLIKTFIEAGKGSIGFVSQEGKGTTFTVRIPIIMNPTEKFIETLS